MLTRFDRAKIVALTAEHPGARLRDSPAQRSSRRRSKTRCTAVRSALIRNPVSFSSERTMQRFPSRSASRSSGNSTWLGLPFGRLCYGGPTAASNAVDYAKSYSRSHDAVIRVYDAGGNVVQTHEPRAISSRPYGYRLGSQLYRKPYASAQCVRVAGDSSTLTMIK
jgi:hypothetical protein